MINLDRIFTVDSVEVEKEPPVFDETVERLF